MGVDLKLLIVNDNLGIDSFSHTVLEFGRNCDLFDEIKRKCKPHIRKDFKLNSYLATIPDGSWRGERGYGEVKDTPYGEPITYVYAGDLWNVMVKFTPSLDGWQKAAMAYLHELPDEKLVALYWH